MKLPRNIGSDDLAKQLSKFKYLVTRQTGSHLRLATYIRARVHNITIPKSKLLKIGTLSNILKDIALYLEISKDQFTEELFS